MRNKLLSTVCAALLGLCVPHHANAVNYGYLRITDNEACTSQAYSQSADILYQKQASFYMAAYGSGTMTMQAMAERLRGHGGSRRGVGLDHGLGQRLAARGSLLRGRVDARADTVGDRISGEHRLRPTAELVLAHGIGLSDAA